MGNIDASFFSALIAASECSTEVIVGHRRVTKAGQLCKASMMEQGLTFTQKQARKYMKKGLYFTKNRETPQLGQGPYLSDDRDSYKTDKSDWYCMIFANKEAIYSASKAWIPPDNIDGDTLWREARRIDEYIKSLDLAPKYTMRFGILDGGHGDDDFQLAIPKALLREKGFAWRVVCVKTKEEMWNLAVNWERWPGIKGHKFYDCGTWFAKIKWPPDVPTFHS
ncbi:hypothetical protein AAL_05860 [Moelleriella libera RCEF 2490]|uniref:Uncharacterized protein n=1 Tax=Moelleriella libera RCEF 2490 TaxID=1081109 RepID=A0A167ZLS0_9HYPO|nr:hypothetical protein AAL_05860 [Moelleriella libera RCEF 2490]